MVQLSGKREQRGFSCRKIVATQHYCWMSRWTAIRRDSFRRSLDRANDGTTFETQAVVDLETEPQLQAFQPQPANQVSARTSADEGGSPDRRGNERTSSGGTTPRGAAPLPGLAETYFRQLGDAGWLSREQEIALAQQIETSQRAMLSSLCRVPMLVERIGVWRSSGRSRPPSAGGPH